MEKAQTLPDDPAALALAWLSSRTQSFSAATPVDLETIDQWRQGLLSEERSSVVKRQLAEDPRLMRMLEELLAADQLVENWDISEEVNPPSIERLRHFSKSVRDFLSILLKPGPLVGFATASAALIVAVLLVPIKTTDSLEREIDDLFATVEVPTGGFVVPWRPRISIRGASDGAADGNLSQLEQLAKQAFQAGMVQGIHKLASGSSVADLNPDGRLAVELAACENESSTCEEVLALSQLTGTWAIAAFLECENPTDGPMSDPFDLLPSLQDSWGSMGSQISLSNNVQLIGTAEEPCVELEEMLRVWGRPE